MSSQTDQISAHTGTVHRTVVEVALGGALTAYSGQETPAESAASYGNFHPQALHPQAPSLGLKLPECLETWRRLRM